MGKYEPLTQFLTLSRTSALPMRFEDIEAVLGFTLPASSRTHRAWWSNNPSNNVMTKAWLAAGFETEQVDIEARKLVFRRVGPVPSPEKELEPGAPKPARRNPLFGWLKGTFTIAPGTDLTEPADPKWGEIAWGDRDDEVAK